MPEKSIIFFDIDGTLLDHNKELPVSAEQAVWALKELGHEVAIATGRAPFMFADIRERLGIDTFVCYNGQYVVLHGELIYSRPLNKEALHDMTELALRHDHAVIYMGNEAMKANVPNDEFVAKSMNTFKLKIVPEHDPLYYHGREIYQSLLMCQAEEEPFYEAVCKDFDFVRWHPNSVDVVPAGGSKAIGIRQITDRLGIAPEHQYCFGDALNDVQMLTMITNSVAMGNGVPEAKAAAKYVTKPVDEDGILHGLRMVGLLM
ncbi:Cof-type HAD-IIB family hydrolase [Paenibacillus sp. P96]|uniref:Cof-type HAD-IIB family hydrolase n=1 Tax=Paenibacillus zeirhizosphaerae TaxID=2987519 RepID=A0ABT9FVF6_9BACL|nr:Cof-type HAD-IIB family hydrolase [Paenibacillus sp. P96]MDP4098501.1 Cof-type HAD-IIB family hydrolase [Paenibacillus sp. P96]